MWNIRLQPHQKLFFTSDTHYSHTNLVKGVTRWRNADGEIPEEAVRDFPDIDTMNELMVENINRNDMYYIAMHNLSIPANKNLSISLEQDPLDEILFWINKLKES